MNCMRRILVVDDERDLALLICKALTASGYEVDCASDGEEGLAKAFAHPPDAILLDVIMPKVDGWEVCRELKNHPETRQIPVVILSALAEKDPQAALRSSGASRIFVKPFNFKELIAYLDQQINSVRS